MKKKRIISEETKRKISEANKLRAKEAKKKRKKTNLERYGVDNSAKSEKSKEKTKKTNLKRYGVSTILKKREKMKTGMLKKYGVDNPLKSEVIKNKIKKTNLERYGVECVLQTEENRYRAKNKFILKCENYIKEKYKDLNILQYKISEKHKNFIEIICDICNQKFDISTQLLLQRIERNAPICLNCNPLNKNYSEKERKMGDFIEEFVEINRNELVKGREVDILIPSSSIGFEFNGVYWHSELYKDKNFHLEKSKECLKKGIKLIHVWEDDWDTKQDIIKSRILNILNLTTNKIYGRKTEIKEVNGAEGRQFLIDNHIQGWCPSQIKLGLYFEEELVSLMTFGKRRRSLGKKESKEGEYELLRFCNKLNTNVIGGASRLFKHFIKTYNPLEVISYADRSWTTDKENNLYVNLGFTFIGTTKPNYWYVVDGTRKHRFNYRKDKLVSEGFDYSKTEHEIMLERNFYRIYDCGNFKFEWKSDSSRV